MTTYESVLATYKAAGQEQVFTFYDSLSSSEQQQLVQQAASIDPQRVNSIYKAATTADLISGDILPPPANIVGDVTFDPKQTLAWEAIGKQAIKDGKVGVLLLAGGQGTRLGSSAPKGCYDIGLPSHKSLFQLQAERVKSLSTLAGASKGIPWYVMTSQPTRKATEEFFQKHGYFGLDSKDVVFFNQGVLPCLTNDGKIIMGAKSEVATAPDGNGGIYAALRAPVSPGSSTSVLSDLAARGVKYIHAYCVDNCLVRIADPVFLGYAIERNAICGAKVVAKTEASESVGVVALRGGKVGVVEYSEIPQVLSEQRDSDGKLSLRAGNIANHFYTIEFLESVASFESTMAYHVANKKIPHIDLSTGEAVKPSKPNGMKLELFIFDVFPFVPVEQFSILEVLRSTDFSPLKNAPGTGSDDPETSRRDLLAENKRWLTEAGAIVQEGVEVEIAPAVSLFGEGLESLKGKKLGKSGVANKLEDFAALV